ncbi:MAG: BrnA antitoxin family protein [Chloroflexota bacterium]|nr:BrnA antitoxin family protein [Chloroflexota bacterium]
MQKNEHIVRYTAAELDEIRARGEDLTDWAYVDSLTDEQIEASIDREEEGEPDWDNTRAGIPGPQQRVSMMVDDDIVAWFRTEVAGTGLGFKTRMNDALREYMEARRQPPAPVEAGSARRTG